MCTPETKLYTLHLGLERGEVYNLVSGVHIMPNGTSTSYLLSAGMLTEDGRCKTLDAKADGYVRAEACCSVLLAPVSEASGSTKKAAVRLRGSAVNQDGRSSSLTAPNGPSQQQVMLASLKRAGASPASVTVLEMHGTGTPLGDPIEVGAAGAVLWTDRRAPLVWAAAKSAVGHTEPGAGLVGLLNAATMLYHRVGKQIMHLRSINPHVEGVLGSPHVNFIPRQCAQTLESEVSSAGSSAFAFQGTNVHVVLSASDRGSATPARSHFLFEHLWFIPVDPFYNYRRSILFSRDGVEMRLSTATIPKAQLAGHLSLARSVSYSLEVMSWVSRGKTAISSCVQYSVGPGEGVQLNLLRNGVLSVKNIARGGVIFSGSVQSLVGQNNFATSDSILEPVRIPASMVGTRNAVSTTAGSFPTVNESSGFHIPPNVLDCCLQTAQFLRRSGSTFVPTGMDACAMPTSMSTAESVFTSASMDPASSDATAIVDFCFQSPKSMPNMIRGLRASVISKQELKSSKAALPQQECLYLVSWQASSAGSGSPPHQSTVKIGGGIYGGAQLSALAAVQRIAVLSSAANRAVELRICTSSSLITSAAPDASVDTDGGGVRGLMRTLAQECPQLLCSGLDSEAAEAASGTSIAFTAIQGVALPSETSAAQGMAERSGYLAAPLLAPSRVLQSPEPMQLVPRPRGSLHSLAHQAVQSSLGGSLVLGPGECQLRVMCVGLNFRDVLNVLGMYPGDPGDPGGARAV